MTVSVSVAAKRLCEGSGWTLSNLEIQKLLYLAHMLHLGRNNEPLISGYFEAWDYGPVQPTLYHKAKVFGSDPVENIFHSVPELNEDATENAPIQEVLDQLSDAAPGRLVAITHWDRGAWAKHYKPGMRSIVIPDDDIRQEYLDRVHAAEERRAG